jgi:VWFA-related protein
MLLRSVLPTLYTATVLLVSAATGSQTPVPFSMKVSVNEVELTLHAEDSNGTSIKDLHLDELRILDNGKPPSRILEFQAMRDLPIRAAILIDTSSSMAQSVDSIHAIATTYAQHVLERKTDQAFVASFNKRLQMRQAWSNNPAALTHAIAQTGTYPSITAIYDNIYSICRYQFAQLPHNSSGNFIMLFSDGEDDASSLSLQAAVDMCQQTNTAIYAFRPDSASAGLRNLSQLAALTGGRVFRIGVQQSDISEDLEIIQSNLRNQYRLIYSPSGLKHDGSFHQVTILPANRVAYISTRSGYYAPSH